MALVNQYEFSEDFSLVNKRKKGIVMISLWWIKERKNSKKKDQTQATQCIDARRLLKINKSKYRV